MIKLSTVQAIRDLPIEEVIEKYLTEKLMHKGKTLMCKSPFSDEKTASFVIFPHNNNFKDFSSGKQGDAISFVMDFKNLSYIEAIKEIASDHRIEVEYENWTEDQKQAYQKEQEERKEIFKIMEWAKNHFMNNDIPARWRQQRVFNIESLAPYCVGYGSGSTNLYDDAIKAGFSKDLLKKAGLAYTIKNEDPASSDKAVWAMVDSFADRVVFPFIDIRGNCVAFTGRYNGDYEKNDQQKYWNSPDSIWKKGNHLYGLYQAEKSIREEKKAYLVEGPTDVIRMSQWGLQNTVGIGSSKITDDQCKLLFRYTDEVTIVPDNDLKKKVNAGLESLHVNAKKLLSFGFIVRVLIPGNAKSKINVDPDSWLGKMKSDDDFNKWMQNEEGYLDKYLLRICLTMDEGSAEDKFKAVKLMAENLEAVKETGYRNSLYTLICQEYKFFKKEYALEKREKTVSSTEVEKLKREVRDEYFKDRFIEEDGRYVAWDKGKKVELCNFTFNVIFTITFVVAGDPNRKAVLSMTDVFNYHTLAVFDIEDFCTAAIFKKSLLRRGDYIWKAKQNNLDDVYAKNFLNAPYATELDRMGWNNHFNFWVWSNGIYYNNQFHPMDKYGLIKRKTQIGSIDQFKKLRNGSQLVIEGKLKKISKVGDFLKDMGEAELQRLIDGSRIYKVDFFWLPFGKSLQIETGDDDKGIDFKKDIKLIVPEKDQEWTFDMWADKINTLYGKNGWVMISYYLGCIFRDFIHKHQFGWFPLLYFFGRPRSGKSTAAKSVYYMFGDPPQKEGINLSSGSTETGMIRYMNTITNIPGLFNEYKNHVRERIKEVMKGWVDGSGRVQGTKSAKGTEQLLPKSGALICGQELPSSEAALMDRIIPLEFREENRPSKTVFEAFKKVEETGIFTWITCKILEFRPLLKHYADVDKIVYESLSKKSQERGIKSNDRLYKNASSILTITRLLMDYTDLKFPFSYDELEDHVIEVMRHMTMIQAESDEVEIFFRVLMSIANTPAGIQEGKDFMIKNTGSKKLLYIRYRACWGKYSERASKEGVHAMPESSLSTYLKTHPCYIESTKNARFPSIERTSALIFDYEYLLEKEIVLHATKEMSAEEIAHHKAKVKDEFEKLIKGLKPEKLFDTTELTVTLSHEAKDHITKTEFLEMCVQYNEKKNGIEIKKNDDDDNHIYTVLTGQSDLPF